MRINKLILNIKIGIRLNIIISTLMALIFISLGTYIIINLRNEMHKEADLRMFAEIDDLSRLVENEIELNQKRVNVGLSYTKQYILNLGNITISQTEKVYYDGINQITNEVIPTEVKSWQLDRKTVQNSFSIVDSIAKEIGGTSTIFQKIPQGYLRITTNVISKQGERGVGTYIPNSSPVVETISRGSDFFGRAYVIDDWYLTGYSPLYINNQIKGIIYYGIKEKNLPGLKDIFYSKKYYGKGYPSIISANGQLIIHPTMENENISGLSSFSEILRADLKDGKIQYNFQGEKIIQYFKYVKVIDSYISATIYEKDLLKTVYKLRTSIIVVLILGISLFVLVNNYLSRLITDGLKKGVDFAETLAMGDLTKTITINQRDEVGQLANALNRMGNNLSKKEEQLLETNRNIMEIEQLLTNITDNMFDLVSITNHNGEFQYVSRSHEILGYQPSFLLGRDLFEFIHPDDIVELRMKYNNLLGKGSTEKYEFRYRCFNGIYIWIETIGKTLDNNQYLFSSRDITARKKMELELKKSEEKYRFLVENSATMFWIIDKIGTIRYISPYITQILDITPEKIENNSFKFWTERVYPDDLNDLLSDFKLLFDNDIRLDSTFRMKNNTEEWKWLHCIGNKNNNIFGEEIAYGILTDITEKKHSEQHVLKAIIQSEEKERSRIAQDLHDGVSPLLSAIKLFTQSMRDSKNERISSELSGKISTTVTEAIQSINEISTNISPHVLENFGLIHAVNSFLNKISSRQKIKYSLESDLEERLPRFIEVALYRISIELINNSLKHAHSSNIGFKYSISETTIHMKYFDDGIGFDTNKVLNRKEGMGLYNIKNRVSSLNGNSKILSTFNDGMQVIISIPLTN